MDSKWENLVIMTGATLFLEHMGVNVEEGFMTEKDIEKMDLFIDNIDDNDEVLEEIQAVAVQLFKDNLRKLIYQEEDEHEHE